MTVHELNRGSLGILPWMLAAVAITFLAGQARGEDETPSIVALFCGWGDSTGGASGELHYCGIGGEKRSRFDGWWIQYQAAIGEADATAEGDPDIDFTSASLGMKRLFGEPESYPRPFLGAKYWRATAIVAVPQLGVDVVGVDHGPGAFFGVEWAAIHGYPIKTTLNYEWSQRAPKPETGGLCVGWGPIEVCWWRAKVQGREIEGPRVTGFIPLGKR